MQIVYIIPYLTLYNFILWHLYSDLIKGSYGMQNKLWYNNIFLARLAKLFLSINTLIFINVHLMFRMANIYAATCDLKVMHVYLAKVFNKFCTAAWTCFTMVVSYKNVYLSSDLVSQLIKLLTDTNELKHKLFTWKRDSQGEKHINKMK